MRWRVVLMPGAIIYILPVFARHQRMGGCDVLRVVAIHVFIHRSALRIKHLMISGPWQRSEYKKLEQINLQLFLDYPDITLNARCGIAWEANDVSSEREHLGLPPGLE